ncbi:uncharacterized protein LOC127881471 [Dreissena polymorpha]|uniref:Uncharacterized protein n=1 Tax=Dreissena polymorpha TaxID=45954 RepID=A0A9D4H6D0_DREPO|nr:uncharacterized protein LOC127881471 [Dreissena polymorpha]KAH3828238.1 hypothetical protein DPMN_130191 [Dreissena polymorpha]
MDNNGYAVDFYGHTLPPRPVYEFNGPPVRYIHRRSSYSDSSLRSDGRRYTVENPPDGGYWAWIVVLACAVLHICSELTFFVFYDTLVIAHVRNPLLKGLPKDTYTEWMVFEDVRFTGEIVAAFFSVYLGYRVVAVVGSACVLGGFLGASFVTPSKEIELMGFLVGFLGGIGVSFWRFAAFVAIMEYFRRHRMAAIILSGFGRVIGIFIGYGILSKPLQELLDSNTTQDDLLAMTSWPTYYQCQCAMAGVGFLASLVITPLDLATPRRGHECAWILRIRDSRVCRGGMFFFLLCVYFLYYFGEPRPFTELVYWMLKEKFITKHILGVFFATACGVLLGYILLIFWPRRKKFYSSVLWFGLLFLLMGLITLQLPVFDASYTSYVCAFAIILAASQVLFESILRYVIPIAFGRQYIRWVEGCLGLFAGCATIANNFICNALRTKSGGSDNVFYFAGSAFLAAGCLAVIGMQGVICLKFKDRNHEKELDETRLEKPLPPVGRYLTYELR